MFRTGPAISFLILCSLLALSAVVPPEASADHWNPPRYCDAGMHGGEAWASEGTESVAADVNILWVLYGEQQAADEDGANGHASVEIWNNWRVAEEVTARHRVDNHLVSCQFDLDAVVGYAPPDNWWGNQLRSTVCTGYEGADSYAFGGSVRHHEGFAAVYVDIGGGDAVNITARNALDADAVIEPMPTGTVEADYALSASGGIGCEMTVEYTGIVLTG